MRFSVLDHGRGIPADMLEAVFLRFQQVDSSDAREKGGTGLGLAISRSIVESMGGQIRVESEPGRATTFSFTVPRPEPHPAVVPAPADAALTQASPTPPGGVGDGLGPPDGCGTVTGSSAQ